MRRLAPIVLFVFNRPEHTMKVVEALQKSPLAKSSDLFIFSDGPRADNPEDLRKCSEVLDFVRVINGFRSIRIFENEKNLGLSESIKLGLSTIFMTFERAIIVEDDILTEPTFLEYMNQALEVYKIEGKVAGVTGYAYPFKKEDPFPNNYFLPIGSSWGWGTWKRVWESINFNSLDLLHEIEVRNLVESFNFGEHNFYQMLIDESNAKLNSWDVCFYASFFLDGQYFLFPKQSMVFNLGFDNSGTHSKFGNSFMNQSFGAISFQKVEVTTEDRIVELAKRILPEKPNLFLRVVQFIKRKLQ